MDVLDHSVVLERFIALAIIAGREIMAVRERGVTAWAKSDDSPVTEADQRAEAAILAGLARDLSDIPVVAEEEVAAGRCPKVSSAPFILVDALDGTREFLKSASDFTVNIALINGGEPIVGVVYAPALNELYGGRPGHAEKMLLSDEGSVSERTKIECSAPESPLRIVASKSHRTDETNAFIDRFVGCDAVAIGSSLKFCLLAAGEADLYPRFGRTMEWDTAAGDAVLRAAGGRTETLDGELLRYGKCNQSADSDFANPHFIAMTPGAVAFV